MPMHRWMASAAGGTSQRLKPGPAMMRSLSSKPGARAGVWRLPPKTDGMRVSLFFVVWALCGRTEVSETGRQRVKWIPHMVRFTT